MAILSNKLEGMLTSILFNGWVFAFVGWVISVFGSPILTLIVVTALTTLSVTYLTHPAFTFDMVYWLANRRREAFADGFIATVIVFSAITLLPLLGAYVQKNIWLQMALLSFGLFWLFIFAKAAALSLRANLTQKSTD